MTLPEFLKFVAYAILVLVVGYVACCGIAYWIICKRDEEYVKQYLERDDDEI